MEQTVQQNEKRGSVMVVGAGIAGIQASIDLADSGYKVYLVETGPSIGGVMTQLDKTFPTNDCSMCIVSPKLVEASRHNNIETLTYSEVESVSGGPGNYMIKIRKKARSVDADKCTGCGQCMAACPVQNIIRIPDREIMDVTDEVAKTDRIIDSCGAAQDSLIQILQEVHAEFNYLPEDALRRISLKLHIPYAEVFGTASFYKAFSFEPKGKHLIQICMGTACHVRGAAKILEEFEKLIGIDAGMTSDDKLFTLETVNCLGACALGPIAVVDEEYHGNLKTSDVGRIVDTYAKLK